MLAQLISSLSKKATFLPLSLLAAVVIAGCGGNNPNVPDVAAIKVSLVTKRFDKDLYAIDTNRIGDGLTKLKPLYPDFLDFFLDTVMGFGLRGNYSDTSAAIREGVKEYLAYKDYRDLQATIEKKYPNTQDVDKEIEKGFQYMKHYFPASITPRVYYINHILLNVPAFCVDTSLCCVCLDMFLDADFAPYKSVGIPDYLAPHLRKNYIPVALFASLYQTVYPFKTGDKSLLELMIQKGKEQYYLHKLLPNTPDSVLFGFTGNQTTWCNKNEATLYNYFIQQNLLYNKEERMVMPYVTDGPFARGIGSATDPGKPTPGNVGTFIGYKIIAAFAAQHPELDLGSVMALNIDPTKLLEGAKYKPR